MKKLLLYILCFLLVICPVFSAWAGTAYYVDADAAGGGDGTFATPWNSITQVNANAFSEGDDVYLQVGDTFSGVALVVDWSGNAGDYVIIGAYEAEGDFVLEGGETKPIIFGAGDYSYPASTSPLVQIGTYDYIQLENLDIQYSGGYGIQDSWGATAPIITNCDVSYTARHGINLGASTTTVEYCNVHHFCMQESPTPALPVDMGIGGGGGHNSIIRYNNIYDGFGEGISFYTANNLQIYNNFIGDTWSVAVYLDACGEGLVYNNLIIGTDDTTYRRYTSPDYHGTGIKINVEAAYEADATNNKIYNNIVINRYDGIAIQNSKDDPSYPVDDNTFVQNTLIDNQYNVHVYNADDNLDLAGTTYKHNLHLKIHADVTANVAIVTNDVTNWDADENGYYPSYDDGSETGLSGTDVYSSPAFAQATWRGNAALNNETFSISDLMPTANVVNIGTALGADYDDAFMPNSSKPPTAATTGDQDSYGAGWEYGAVIYVPATGTGQHVIIISRIDIGLVQMM